MATNTNQATISYNGNIINSNASTVELVSDLTVTKTAVIDRYRTGSDTVFALFIVNKSETSYSNLTISDTLGGYAFNGSTVYPLDYRSTSIRYFINGVLQSTPSVNPTPALTISGINVPAGAIVTLLYEAIVTDFAPLNAKSVIVNTATVRNQSGTVNISASRTIFVVESPDLSIIKSMCPSAVISGSEVTYTFTIANINNTAATSSSNIKITDTFEPPLSNVSVNLNGVAWSAPTNYSYNSVTGLFTTVSGQITVPAATYTQDSATGAWITNPGKAVLTITGTIT